MRADRDTSLVMDALIVAAWHREEADALNHHFDSYDAHQLSDGLTKTQSDRMRRPHPIGL